MRIALISDIHSNLVSFEAVLQDIKREKPDRIVCLGDISLTGPQPRETLELLQTLNCPVVMGNCDEWLLKPEPFEAKNEHRQRIKDVDLWCVEQMTAGDTDYLRTFEKTIEISFDDKTKLLCFHGSPNSNQESIRATTPDGELGGILSGFHASIMAGGHTHTQMIRRFRETIVMNPGSIGLPYDPSWTKEEEVRNPPWAEYALIRYEKKQLGIEVRRVPVDIQAVKQAALQSSMPHKEWWAAGWR